MVNARLAVVPIWLMTQYCNSSLLVYEQNIDQSALFFEVLYYHLSMSPSLLDVESRHTDLMIKFGCVCCYWDVWSILQLYNYLRIEDLSSIRKYSFLELVLLSFQSAYHQTSEELARIILLEIDLGFYLYLSYSLLLFFDLYDLLPM